jgi:cytochrome c-type biogenesis protein CcmH/NrfG
MTDDNAIMTAAARVRLILSLARKTAHAVLGEHASEAAILEVYDAILVELERDRLEGLADLYRKRQDDGFYRYCIAEAGRRVAAQEDQVIAGRQEVPARADTITLEVSDPEARRFFGLDRSHPTTATPAAPGPEAGDGDQEPDDGP